MLEFFVTQRLYQWQPKLTFLQSALIQHYPDCQQRKRYPEGERK
jgi:hypothetical protein